MPTDRIQLPPTEPRVEPAELVRARGARRAGLVGGLLAALLGLVAVRGASLCLFPNERTLRAAAVQRWDQVTLRARRGEVLDRNGRRLATSVATPNVVADPLRIDPAELDALAARVADVLDLPAAEVADKMRKESRYQRLAVRVHPKVAAAVESLDHPALWIEREPRRYYPEETLGAQILGFVDAAGAGREGMEAALDVHLRGGSVLLQRRRDRRGLDVDDPTATDRNVGMDVHLTIDRTIQRMAERALEGIVERSAPLAASVVVVDVRTGDLLALANVPTFNPNDIGEDPVPRKNHVVQDAIEPGSVFKPFTVAAAVEEGLVTAESKIDCEGGGWTIGRSRIRDDHPHGVVTIRELLKYSSNIGSAKLALQLGAEKAIGYFRAFGFAERTGLPLPGERSGVLRKPDRIKPIELATTAFGQGVTVTPLQLAMALAALGNDGVRMKPRLVTRVEDGHGVPEQVHAPAIAARVVSTATARSVVEMMVSVTEDGGTATRARVPGYVVAGKTGTAQKVADGRYGNGRIGSFVGLVPADDPVLSIVVTVDEPTVGSRYGGIVAAPAFAEIAGGALRHLGVAPDPALLVDPKTPAPAEPAPAVADAEEDPGPIRLAWDGAGWTLPDLSGRTMRDVVASLEPAGLALSLQGSGRVVAQVPPPGSTAPPGSPVELVLR